MIRNKSSIWHPFTQHALFPEFLKISRAKGAYLFTEDGQQIIDAIASWWVITHGHCHPRIQRAATKQIQLLDQVIFAGYTHEPAERVSELMVELTPDGLDYVFFSDSGSTAVEVGLKMALGHWHHLNIPKSRVVVLAHSYHGDTIGTMSVGARGVFNKPYNPLLFSVESIPFPQLGKEQLTLDAFESKCKENDDIAALIIEPLVLGAGGMLMYGPDTLRTIKQICERYDVLFIADEVMTAWGRTGTMFACNQADIVPDIACYSKGITGGFIPLAVTMCHERIFESHYSKDKSKTFFHSSSYTANPIACAVAAENLQMWMETDILAQIQTISDIQQRKINEMSQLKSLANVRRSGTITAMDVRVSDSGYLSDMGNQLYRKFQQSGVLLRPLGNTIYVLPPFCMTQQDFDTVYDVITETVVELVG